MKPGVAAVVALAAASLCIPWPAAAANESSYASLKWRSVGPAVAGGRVPAVAGSTTNTNLYYIGAAGGGVWKTVNGGATWTPVFEKEPVSAIGAVTIDPTNDDVVWVGTGESNPRNDVTYGDGVYKTTDGGKTWTNVGLVATRHISRILVDPKNPNHVIVGAFGDPFRDSTDRGVYTTDDGGKTWTKALYVGPQTGASELAMDPNNSAVIYASMWQFRREPWTFHSGGPDDGIWRSTDGGKTWTRLTGHGLPAGYMGRSAVAIAPTDSKRIYAIIEAKGGILWRSDDGGDNWSMVSSDTLVDQRPFYFTHLNVDPKDENHVYAVSMMLAESKDGGHKFKSIASQVHVDYHAMWIAPNDPNRMMVGEDGGYALTLDGGKNWSDSRNIPIGEVYHVGLSNENPYWVCAPLQDNNGFCGPSMSRNPEGILNEHWQNVIGGDGMWAVPDPVHPDHVLTDLQTGRISDYNKKTQVSRYVQPYFDFNRYDFQLFDAKYRFNWDSPISFAPWDGNVLWLGGDVVFQSTDRGVHWKAISPDLTLNLKSHQQPSGGPLALDVSSAEFSDNLLDIEGSPAKRGEIWTGADDGVISVTTDGGKSWHKYTPAGIPPYGRIETVAPSPFDPATAYANVDRHRSGDYKPYLIVTHDYGKTWHMLTNGLPSDQWVRTVRPDNKNRSLLFAGTENGMWISYDGGAQWSNFKLNLPTVSVRDIREQPQFNDLAIATHGRDLWILDDLSSIQELPQAQRSGAMLFKPRTGYQYDMHSNDEGAYTNFAGQNPPMGVVIDFYQSTPQANAPSVEILDKSGHVIRRIKGASKKSEAASGGDEEERGPGAGPGVPNEAGINRVVWNFREDGPPQWNGTVREFRGPQVGALVVPGTYSARIQLNGRTFTQSFEVKADPESPYSQAELVEAYRFSKKYLDVQGQINTMLNQMDAQRKSLQSARATALKSGDSALVAKIDAAQKAQDAIFHRLTANYKNGEDSIQFPGELREDIPRGGFGAASPPTPALLDYAKRFDSEYAQVVAEYHNYVQTVYDPVSTQFNGKAAGKK